MKLAGGEFHFPRHRSPWPLQHPLKKHKTTNTRRNTYSLRWLAAQLNYKCTSVSSEERETNWATLWSVISFGMWQQDGTFCFVKHSNIFKPHPRRCVCVCVLMNLHLLKGHQYILYTQEVTGSCWWQHVTLTLSLTHLSSIPSGLSSDSTFKHHYFTFCHTQYSQL